MSALSSINSAICALKSTTLGNSDIKNPEDELSNVEILFRKTSKNMTPEQKEVFQKELLEFMEIRRKAFEEDQK